MILQKYFDDEVVTSGFSSYSRGKHFNWFGKYLISIIQTSTYHYRDFVVYYKTKMALEKVSLDLNGSVACALTFVCKLLFCVA